MVGNRAFGRLQPTLMVNQPGDAYEIEADRVADHVMTMPKPQVQRGCACGGTCDDCRTNDEPAGLQRAAAASAGPDTAPPIVHEVLREPGRALDPSTQAFMEPRFRRNLGDVRIHTDERAGRSAQAVHAHAYAVGQDIVFAPGRYRPETRPGQWLLAHELAHVVSHVGAPTALHRYDESTDPNTALGQAALAVAPFLVGGPLWAIPAYFCLRPLERPMIDITFTRWIPAVCAREGAPFLPNRTWDSFGHCWIGCEASRKCGTDVAALAGGSRELYRELQRILGIRPHDSFKQDIGNQKKGRRLSFTAGTCYTLCDESYRTGGLDLSAPEGTCIDCASQVEGACPP